MMYQEGADSFYSRHELDEFGFAKIGSNVLISRKASIYNPEFIELSDNVRVDDFCCLSGRISLKRHTHVTAYCLLAGGEKGLFVGEFCTFAYRVSIFTQSDDYFGNSMVNSTIPPSFKMEKKASVCVLDHVIIGAGSIVLPGLLVAEGTSVGAHSLLTKSTEPWGIYYGAPALRKKNRSREILNVTHQFLQSTPQQSSDQQSS